MSDEKPFDPLQRFAEIERLVSKIYFRFSHLFLAQPELRDFWWEMAKEEEQHACIHACRAVIENFAEQSLDPRINPLFNNSLGFSCRLCFMTLVMEIRARN